MNADSERAALETKIAETRRLMALADETLALAEEAEVEVPEEVVEAFERLQALDTRSSDTPAGSVLLATRC